MRVRLEAVIALGYSGLPEAGELVQRVAARPTDMGMDHAIVETLKYISAKADSGTP